LQLIKETDTADKIILYINKKKIILIYLLNLMLKEAEKMLGVVMLMNMRGVIGDMLLYKKLYYIIKLENLLKQEE